MLREDVVKIFNSEKYQLIKKCIVSSQPVCILLGGQPASGKSNLVTVAEEKFSTTFLNVNGDDYRQYHPCSKKLIKSVNDYSEKTQIFSNVFTEELINAAINNQFNIIIEGTMRNSHTSLDTALRFKNSGFKVYAFVIAVPGLVTELGIYDRYQKEVNRTGFGRLADVNVHNIAIDGLKKTIDVLYAKNAVDGISIFTFRAEKLFKEYNLTDKKTNQSAFLKPSDIIHRARDLQLNDKIRE